MMNGISSRLNADYRNGLQSKSEHMINSHSPWNNGYSKDQYFSGRISQYRDIARYSTV
ncbi:MAG: hypothetical protein HY831_02930 [Candidatus Aenigmarchaeota archaeon]|nr:hypothetical protein [Candidatus Aenigmarchaeota archaeon]